MQSNNKEGRMLDINHYADKASLIQIREWDILTQGVQGLLDLVEENTNHSDWSISITGKRVLRFQYHTGGWSGNEDVIAALRQNWLFWAMCWQKSTRGGHFYFKINLSITKEAQWNIVHVDHQKDERNLVTSKTLTLSFFVCVIRTREKQKRTFVY